MSKKRVFDPRGKQTRAELSLAPRASRTELEDAPVLFCNNTKLDFCAYPELFPAIKDLLRARGISNFVDRRESVRGKDTPELRRFAGELADSGARAAIIGLADIGVTPATTILTTKSFISVTVFP